MRKAVLVLLLLTGCAGSVVRRDFTATGTDFDFRDPHCGPPASSSEFSVQYLGSGGVYINWKGDGLLIGPYFSHSGGVGLAQTAHVHFDESRIRAGMKDVKNVRAILFGHSHFDHIGDLPIVATKYVPGVPIYLNRSGINLLGKYPELQARAVSVEDTPEFDAGSSIHVRAVRWGHAPQLCRLPIWPCRYAFGEAPAKDKEFPDLLLRELRGGRTYAYVIELREDNQVRYRIYYNDAAFGGSGEMLPDGPYDLAIICMASFDFVRDYPMTLLSRLQPRRVLISHYEDFFTKQKTESWSFVPLMLNCKANRFIREVSKATQHGPKPLPAESSCGVNTDRWSIPAPGHTLVFR